MPVHGRHPRTPQSGLVAEHLDIGVLHTAHPSADPMGKAFDYAKEFKSLDLNAVIKDLQR